MSRIRALTAERLLLLRLLARTPYLAVVLTVCHLLTALVPSAMAAATGWLVARLTGVATGTAPWSAAIAPLAALAALLLAEEVLRALGEAIANAVASHIDRRVRARVRALALAPGSLAHLEDPDFADDASRASDVGVGRVRSPGTAAVGQLWLMFRVVSALSAAVVLSVVFTPLLAVPLVAAALTMRAIIRRQWIHLAEVRDGREAGRRRVTYWSEVAATAAASKEVRMFGLAEWIVRRRTAEALDWMGEIWATRRGILGEQGRTVALASGSALAGFLVPGIAVVDGALTPAQLVTCIVAAWTIYTMSSMGFEAFDIEYGLGAVRALERLEARSAPPRHTP